MPAQIYDVRPERAMDGGEGGGPAAYRGYAGLDDLALLGRILGGGHRRPDEIASMLFRHFGSLGDVVSADPYELERLTGASAAVTETLGLARELAVRLARIEVSRSPVLGSWSVLVAYVRAALAHLPREQFRTLYLDRKHRLLRDELLTEGAVDHAPVYPREVIRRALELSASAMVLVHNHPSGDPTPSRADIEMTRRIVEAARVFELTVHDHLVIGRDGTASFKSLGLI